MRYQKIYGFLLFFLYSLPTFAARTDCISQMALADISGNPITTSVEYEIHFYPTITGGAELTTAASGTVTPSNGILSLQFDCSTVTSNSAVFMEYVINSETLSPRVEMVSAPFAATAFSALSVSGDVTLGSGTSGNYVQSLSAGNGISMTGTTGESATHTISVDTGTSANKIVQLDASSRLPAVDASQLTNITIGSGIVTSGSILDGTILTGDLADSSVTSLKIVDGTIVAADIAADTIDSSKISADAVGSSEIATGAVTTTEILDGTISSTDIAPDGLDFSSLADTLTLDSGLTTILFGGNILALNTQGGTFRVFSGVGEGPQLQVDFNGINGADAAATSLFAITEANLFLNLTNGQSSQRLCFSGIDGSTGFVSISDCDGAQADMAELYGTHGDLNPGDVVTIDGPGFQYQVKEKGPLSKAYITKSDTAYSSQALGVVSTNPSGEILGEGIFDSSENPVPLALVGRVPVNVTTKNGPIKVGDYLTSSDELGYAMKASHSGPVLGISLEDLNEGEGQVLMFIHSGWQEINPPLDCQSQSGSVTIKKNEATASIKFEKSYRSVPQIQLTPTQNPQGTYWIEKKSTDGFTLAVDKASNNERSFDWFVLCLNNQ